MPASAPHPLLFRAPLAVLAALLVACGGGGGGDGGSTPLPAVDTSVVAAADPGSPLPANWQRGAFAEIFVRAYQDSDGDGIGDLRGLISRLDYLQDLGIRGIWLMPITKSQDGDHGYAVADYRAVEPAYGTLADLDALVAAAHARGIGVVLDYVMNHSAARHPAFVNARAAKSNPFRDWYVWRDSAPSGWGSYDGSNPWRSTGNGAYYGVFWDQMPDWNLRNPAVVAWHHDHLRFWLNRGIDGFRFDAVGNLFENGPDAWLNQPENHPLLGGVRSLLDGYARRWMVCEGPSDPLAYAATASCGSAFAFGLNGDIVSAANGDAAAAGRVAAYFETAPARMATMLSNHDTFAGQRAWDQFGGDLARYKLAAATYLLLPGTPFVYYGEEIGMAGAAGLSGDPKLRTPMSWTATQAGFTSGTPFRALSANIAGQNAAAQLGDPASLHAFYKAMIGLRNTLPALAGGDYRNAGASGSTVRFQRRLGGQSVQVAIHYGSAPATVSFTGLPASATLAAAWPAGGAALVADASGQASASMPAQSVRVWVVGN